MPSLTRLVEVRQKVLKQNDVVARAMRQRFHDAGVYVVSLVSSPGSGKTLASGRCQVTDDPLVASRVLREVAESFLHFGIVARREAEQQNELKGAPDILVTVPYFDADIYDMEGLIRLGQQVWD